MTTVNGSSSHNIEEFYTIDRKHAGLASHAPAMGRSSVVYGSFPTSDLYGQREHTNRLSSKLTSTV
jgi:hypothetical protein